MVGLGKLVQFTIKAGRRWFHVFYTNSEWTVGKVCGCVGLTSPQPFIYLHVMHAYSEWVTLKWAWWLHWSDSLLILKLICNMSSGNNLVLTTWIRPDFGILLWSMAIIKSFLKDCLNLTTRNPAGASILEAPWQKRNTAVLRCRPEPPSLVFNLNGVVAF